MKRYRLQSRRHRPSGVDGLLQDCSNSIVNALELLQSCIKPLKCILKWCMRKLEVMIMGTKLEIWLWRCVYWLYMMKFHCSPVEESSNANIINNLIRILIWMGRENKVRERMGKKIEIEKGTWKDKLRKLVEGLASREVDKKKIWQTDRQRQTDRPTDDGQNETNRQTDSFRQWTQYFNMNYIFHQP